MIAPTEARGAMELWNLLRAWLRRCHPRRRVALRKRRLEATCRRNGCSRAVASAIVHDYFATER